MSIEHIILESLEPDEEGEEEPLTGWEIWLDFVGPFHFGHTRTQMEKVDWKNKKDPIVRNYNQFKRVLNNLNTSLMITCLNFEEAPTLAKRKWKINPHGQKWLDIAKRREAEVKVKTNSWYEPGTPEHKRMVTLAVAGKVAIMGRKPSGQ